MAAEKAKLVATSAADKSTEDLDRSGGEKKKKVTGTEKTVKKDKKKRKAKDPENKTKEQGTWEVRPVRQLAPGRLKYRRGSLRRALRRTKTAAALEIMARTYEDRKLAPGSRKAQQARIGFWVRRARAHQVDAFPLDVPKVKLLGSLLFAGSYRSAGSYLSAAKAEHLRLGHPWSDPLSKEVRDGVRACTRGQGPDKQSEELDLDALARCTSPVRLRPGWPIAGKDVALTMGCWMLREVEGGTARLNDVSFQNGRGCGRSTWRLPCSKTDVRALGHARTHGCSCPDPACPTAALRRVVALAQEVAVDKPDDERPLFPDSAGNFVSKGVMVALFRSLAQLLHRNPLKITGHMPRVSGARRMARAGVDLFQIQLFARWESSVVLRYVKEAPLAQSHLLAERLATQQQEMHEQKPLDQDLTEIADDSADAGKLQEKIGSGWRDALLNEVEANLGGEVAADPKCVDKKIIEQAAVKVLNAQVAPGLPAFVLNDSLKNRLRVHRPRDQRFALCGWPWAEMVACGTGVTLQPAEGAYYIPCGTCLRRARLRELAVGP